MSESVEMKAGVTPRQLGYRWPAEWEHQAATWLAWPHNRATWPGKFGPVPAEFAAFVKTIARFEPVQGLAGGKVVMQQARAFVGGVANVTLHDVPTNDAWCRDYGPTFLALSRGAAAGAAAQPALLDWRFNAWGSKYSPCDADDAVPARIAAITGRRRFAVDLVLEGGAIENNGAGTILTTASCLLGPTRNPAATREAVERLLCENLAAEKILWLQTAGVEGDDTDGHIDQLARFVDARTVLAAVASDPDDPNRPSLEANVAELRQMTNQAGQSLDVIPLPTPRPLFHAGHRLPASYCNYCLVNGAVIVPAFGEPTDVAARAILADCFPDREVILLPALDLVWGLGAFHCLSQQEAA